MPCSVCHKPASPAILSRFAGVCARCHSRHRYVPQRAGLRCDCFLGDLSRGREHYSYCRSLETHKDGYLSIVRHDYRYS